MKRTSSDYEDFFRAMGVKDLEPGFHLSDAFLAAELRKPDLLEDYAQYIRAMDYTDEYLDRARSGIDKVVEFLTGRIKRDGKKGLCVDASGTASQFLDRLGIWNYIVKGCMSFYPEPSTGFKPAYFTIVTPNKVFTGHAWVVAPPYKIVDITLRQQPYPGGQDRVLPDFVAATDVIPAMSEPQDWIDGPYLVQIPNPTMRHVLDLTGQEFVDNSKRFGTCEVPILSGVLRYIPYGMTAPPEPLEGMKNLCLSGDLPDALYSQFRQQYGL